MVFTMYTICVIALASLVDPSYAEHQEFEVQFQIRDTEKRVGVSDLQPNQVLSAKEDVGNTKWILVKVSETDEGREVYIIQPKDNPKLIWDTKTKSCDDETEVVLVEKPESTEKCQHFYYAGLGKIVIYNEQCGKANCLYVDETSMEIKFSKDCKDHKEREFDLNWTY
ncbi:uncharacterized protein LOC114348756 [Diabrotica virgifera virgifera]|uniref:Uncharacterized protein n=1 Tax=Diabrotica virgifera virgifera TaxID=50390 RepID=A0ABM5J027_DIAVI|nr:uncharacterized protein LOC114348756 [Diabrotica virgifera virgifera]